jgi:hypothetical protein
MYLLLAVVLSAIAYIVIGVVWTKHYFPNLRDDLVRWSIFNWPLDLRLRITDDLYELEAIVIQQLKERRERAKQNG